MTTIPINPATLEVARRVVWFESPEQALRQPIRFLAYAMSYARHEDMKVIRSFVSDKDLRDALDHAPPGIIDPRSWAYWNAKMGRYPPPPLPRRRLESAPVIRQSAEDLKATGRAAWRRARQQSAEQSPEEVSRDARQKWLTEYGPDSQTKKPRSS